MAQMRRYTDEVGYFQEDTRNEAVTVSNTSVKIADVRPERKVIYINNTSNASDKIITVVFGNQSAVVNAGQVLAVGDISADSSDGNYQCYQGVITAICAVAGGQLSIFER